MTAGSRHLRRSLTVDLERRSSVATDRHARSTTDLRHGVAEARWLLGFVFLWAFVDQTFGLGYSAASDIALARHDWAGELTSSTNPLVDDHVISAIALVVIALTAGAGATWGRANRWRQVPVVERHPIDW